MFEHVHSCFAQQFLDTLWLVSVVLKSWSSRLQFTGAIKRMKDDLLGHSGDAMKTFECRSKSVGVAWTKMTCSKSKKQAWMLAANKRKTVSEKQPSDARGSMMPKKTYSFKSLYSCMVFARKATCIRILLDSWYTYMFLLSNTNTLIMCVYTQSSDICAWCMTCLINRSIKIFLWFAAPSSSQQFIRSMQKGACHGMV